MFAHQYTSSYRAIQANIPFHLHIIKPLVCQMMLHSVTQSRIPITPKACISSITKELHIINTRCCISSSRRRMHAKAWWDTALKGLMISTTASWWYTKPAAWINNKGTFGRQKFLFCWSGLRGSNPPPPPWQGGALPNELNPRIFKMATRMGLEPTTSSVTG